MGGSIDVSSEEGRGSIFRLMLPYRPTTTLIQQADDRGTIDKKFSGNVLIAEDTPELQLLEKRILEGMGVSITIASNGQEAVDRVNAQSFDLILMDMQMPVMDGLEATQVLRGAGNQIPIIALTANVMQKHRDVFEEAGCDGFLAKPIDRQELRHVLEHYLNK